MIFISKKKKDANTYMILLSVIKGKNYDKLLLAIPGVETIESNKSYILPYTTEAYRAFKNLNIPYQINTSNSDHHSVNTENTSIGQGQNIVKSSMMSDRSRANIDKESKDSNREIKIEFLSGNFTLFVPYQEHLVKWVKSMQRSYWSKHHRCWIAKGTLSNLRSIQENLSYFKKEEYDKIASLISKIEEPKKVEIWKSPELKNHIYIKATGFGIDLEAIIQIPGRSYDKVYRRWIIPYDAAIVDRLIKHYKSSGTNVNYRLPESGRVYDKADSTYGATQTKLLDSLDGNKYTWVKRYIDTMIAQRYSHNTIKQYSGKYLRFLNYYDGQPPTHIDVEQVNNYITHLSMQKISDSALNLSISAIKFYYEKVESIPAFRIEKMKRPRKGRYLPTILSREEVSQILASCANVKHSSILYTLYSSGIRLNELLSIRLTDIHWDRNQIFIRAGKGKKDRVVQLSEVLKKVLMLYFERYKPIYWLYEGKDKMTQYSSSSVQKVVKSAAKKAGIQRRVSPHVLRHCYATHLHDGGTSIRYIQQLLGHKDIKTTLVYTHVSTQDVSQISSPLDTLMLKTDKKRNE